jgi:hypothetical protein
MPRDFKKEFKDLYVPPTKPVLLEVPEMQYVMIKGKGNPNEVDGAYQKAISILYGIQYTIKMSKAGKKQIDGYFDYVVPPLESFWWLEQSSDWEQKSKFYWLCGIRLPEFVNEDVFNWACMEFQQKKNIDIQKARLVNITEGLCVQCMHLGSYNSESNTLKIIDQFIQTNHLEIELTELRRHHEIYLNDPRKTEEVKLKTVLRVPVRRIEK